MENFNYDEQEYIRFIVELSSKANEIAKEYNKLTDKNKLRICLLLEQVLWADIMLDK